MDLKTSFAKVLSEKDDPILLTKYFRSLDSPAHKAGLIIADPRNRTQLEHVFSLRSAMWSVPTTFTLCAEHGGATLHGKFTIYVGRHCEPGAREPVGDFRAWTHLPAVAQKVVFDSHGKAAGHSLKRLCWAKELPTTAWDITAKAPMAWTGDTCNTALDSHWTERTNAYVDGKGHTFCVGSAPLPDDEKIQLFGPQVLPQVRCESHGAVISGFRFGSAVPEPLRPATLVLCITLGARPGVPTRISVDHAGECSGHDVQLVAWHGLSEGVHKAYCLCNKLATSADGAIVNEDTLCLGRNCCPTGWSQRLDFALPVASDLFDVGLAGKDWEQRSSVWCSSHQRRPLCFGHAWGDPGARISRLAEDCSGWYEDSTKKGWEYRHDFTLWLPSRADVAAAAVDSKRPSLFTLLHEDDDCAAFVCPETLELLAERVK